MNLQELQAKGGFVSGALVKRSVEWKHFDEQAGDVVDDKFDVWIARPSYGEIEDVIKGANGQVSVHSSLIATCVRLGADGAERLTYEQARSLEPGLATALINAIKDAGVDLEKKSKPPTPRKSSGTK